MRTKATDLLIKAAEKLFCKHGIKRVSVEEICLEANVSKMTFYRNFSSKIEVVEKVLSILSGRGITKYRTIMNANEPFAERIRSLIEMKRQGAETFGEDLIKDIYASDNEELKAIVEKYRSESLSIFIDDLKKAQKEGLVRRGLRPELVVEMMNVIYQKMADPQFISAFKSMQEVSNELTNFFFYGILGEKDR